MDTQTKAFIVKIAAGALAGALAAAKTDIHAWEESPGPFNWNLAFGRWIHGAEVGALAALGLSAALPS